MQQPNALVGLIEFCKQHHKAYQEWVDNPVGKRLRELLQPFIRPIPVPPGQRQEGDIAYLAALGVGRCELYRLVFELIELQQSSLSMDALGQLRSTYEQEPVEGATEKRSD